MFGHGTATYFELLPKFRDLEAADARRLLSSAYADVLATRDQITRRDPPPLSEVRADLRRLATALEAHAILTSGINAEARAAASFVAAEALSLLLDLPAAADVPPSALDVMLGDPPPDEEGTTTAGEEATSAEPPYRLATERGLQVVECGLLYLTAGFDSNAYVVARDVHLIVQPDRPQGEAFWAERAFRALVALLRVLPESPIVTSRQPELSTSESEPVEAEIRSALFRRIECIATDHLRWLSFRPQLDAATATEQVDALVQLLRENPSPKYADIAHIVVLVGAAVEATAVRALRAVPSPGHDGYDSYVRARAVGRPLVWPSTAQYSTACLPGPSANAVVALPTGSGKSFTAEIAAAQALTEGWVLYLVPTNALAAQVRRDLANGLQAFTGVQVRAFMGDGQYTGLNEADVANASDGSVLVMTPEKCALALRRAPDVFETLRLCVFDECHQIRDTGGRGAIAELVLAHVMAVAPECRVLLMSALLSNPGEAAEWLESATGRRSEPISTPWRPTRTLRAVVGFHRRSSQSASEAARQQLASAAPHRKNWTFPATYALVANLQGAWSDTDMRNYVTLTLPLTGQMQWHRTQVGDAWSYDETRPSGYVNKVTGDLAEFFASAGEKVLAFLPASRHHPFAVADQIASASLPVAGYDVEADDDPRVSALLDLADWELGVASQLREALARGAAIHTSSLVDAERQASEYAFRLDRVPIMLATGTLAQGLNLPATMVIVGGTDVGDRRESRTAEGRLKSLSQLVNAIGRAGRPGFASRSAALVVPSAPIWINENRADIDETLLTAEVLAREDAAVALSSTLEGMVSAALANSFNGVGMTQDELAAFTYLPVDSSSSPSASEILSRSFGIWRHARSEPGDAANVVAGVLGSLGRDFLNAQEVPEWTAAVATRSGLPLPTVVALYRSFVGRPDQQHESLSDWLDVFGEVMAEVPPVVGQAAVVAHRMPAGAPFSKLNAPLITAQQWREGWTSLYSVLRLYLGGDSLATVARGAFEIEGAVSPARSDGTKPIPKLIGLLDRASYGLSMIAGGIAALYATGEEMTDDTRWQLGDQARISLEMLPLAVRNGCGDRGSLSWFRFALRHRRTAHLLASVMPVPPDLTTDEEVESWVATRREQWLEAGLADLDASGDTGRILTAALVVAAGDRSP